MDNIHPTAIISPNAKIGKGTRVGPYSVIEEHVVLGENVEVQSHVVVCGHTTIGNNVKIFPFCVVGSEPQHTKYQGEPTTTTIGENTVLRESVTVHRGTTFGNGTTSVGKNCLIMAYSHVAHDCVVGDNVIIANSVQLAGHVTIEDFVTIGGASEVAQFCRVGRYCFVAGGSTLRKDLPPFLTGKGNEFKVQGINAVGLERNGFSPTTVKRLRETFKIFYLSHLTVNKAIERLTVELGESTELKVFLDFIRESKVGFVR